MLGLGLFSDHRQSSQWLWDRPPGPPCLSGARERVKPHPSRESEGGSGLTTWPCVQSVPAAEAAHVRFLGSRGGIQQKARWLADPQHGCGWLTVFFAFQELQAER